MRALQALRTGAELLWTNPAYVISYVVVLSIVGHLPVLMSSLRGERFLSPPVSLWGFIVICVGWTTSTLSLVGVGRAVWQSYDGEKSSLRDLIPSQLAFPQVLLYALLFSCLVFGGNIIAYSEVFPHPSRLIPIPLWPFVFYLFSAVPLMVINQQIPVCGATRGKFADLGLQWLTWVKLALVAEIIVLLIAFTGTGLLGALLPLEGLVAKQLSWDVAWALSELVNGAMVAVAYRQFTETRENEELA